MNNGEQTTRAHDVKIPESAVQFQHVRVVRAADDIARQVRQEITEGRLKPGAKLPSERALAEELGVSRNTLREAVRSLEQAGLVELKKGAHGGIFITEDNSASITGGMLDLYRLGTITPRQLTEARLWIEPIIVREACRRATKQDIALLNANIDQAQAAADTNDFKRKITLHHDFHRILARIAGNPFMLVFVNGLIDVLVEFIERIGPGDNSYVFASRRRFMSYFENANADAAADEMNRVLLQFQETYLAVEDLQQASGKE
ncbi:FadR family transcriptional regulator [Alcaligenaceae bacterium]|nr:FadR family transcriptional regulator [Alcaligenaceae bacterium]